MPDLTYTKRDGTVLVQTIDPSGKPEVKQFASQADYEKAFNISTPRAPTQSTNYPTGVSPARSPEQEQQDIYEQYQPFYAQEQKRRADLITAIGNVYQGQEPQAVMQFINSEPKIFRQQIKEIGRRPETVNLLKAMGSNDTQTNYLFMSEGEQEEFAKNLIKQGRTPETESIYKSIWNEQGIDEFFKQKPVEEKPKPPEESYWKNALDEFYSGLINIGRAFKQMPSVVDIYGARPYDVTGKEKRVSKYPLAAEYGAMAQQARQKVAQEAQRTFIKLQEEAEEWDKAHPELQTPGDWQDWGQNKGGYITSAIVKNLPFSLTVMGTALAAGALGGPGASLVASYAFAVPVNSKDVYDTLIDNGATQEQAIELMIPVGMVISSLDVAGNIPLFGAISKAFNPASKAIRNQVAKTALREYIKAGGKTAGQQIFTENFTENLQQVIQNAVTKEFNPEMELWSGLNETALQTLFATAPTAIFGGAMSAVHVKRSEALATANKEDWIQDELTGEWYKPEKLTTMLTDKIKEFTDAGLDLDSAKLKALNFVAMTKEGAEKIAEFARSVGEEITYSERGAIGKVPNYQKLAEQRAKEKGISVSEASRQIADEQIAAAPQPGQAITIPEGVRPNLFVADIEGMMPETAKRVKLFKLSDGKILRIMSDEGDIYGLIGGKEVGFATKLSDTETDLSVAMEYRNKGIGTELMRQFRKENPGHPTGGLTEGGKRVIEKLTPTTGQAELAKATMPEVPKPVVSEMIPPKAETIAPIPEYIPPEGTVAHTLPIRSYNDPSKFVLYSKSEGTTFGIRRDTYEEAKLAADKDNIRFAEGDKALGIIRTKPQKEAIPINKTIEQRLASYEKKRFKTANDDKQIIRLKKLLIADPNKWQVGDGVGYKPTGEGQVNRGFRIIDVHPESKEVTVQAVRDVGQLADFSYEPRRVEITDLVRDRRFDKMLPAKPETIEPVTLAQEVVTPTADVTAVESQRRARASKRAQFDELVASNAEDRQFRDLLSTMARFPLNRGETWRGRAEKFIGGEEQRLSAISEAEAAVSVAKPPVPPKPPAKPTAEAMKEPEKPPKPTPQELTETKETPGSPKLTQKQSDFLLTLFSNYLANPETTNVRELAMQLRSQELGKRIGQYQERINQLLIEGKSVEEAEKTSRGEALSGKLPNVTTDYFSDLTEQMRDVLFSKVYYTLKDEPFEMLSTIEALTNSLNGKSIPEKPGTGTTAFPEGGSAKLRLQRVFGGTPLVLTTIEKAAEQKKTLKDVVEGIFRETVPGGSNPIPIDEELANYLRSLEPTGAELELGRHDQPQSKLLQDWIEWSGSHKYDPNTDPRTYLEGYTTAKKLTPEEFLNLRLEAMGKLPPTDPARYPFDKAFTETPYQTSMMKPEPPVYEPAIEKEIKQPVLAMDSYSLYPRRFMDEVVSVLKELAWLPVDIGGLIKAMKSSVDMSYWRQIMPLIPGHPVKFALSNVTGWKSAFSQYYAESAWERILHNPRHPELYTIYEKIGADFYRKPSFAIKKGTSQYKGTEEYGYLTDQRLIPKLTSKLPNVKISQRAFEAAINSMLEGCFETFYETQLKLSEMYADGRIKLKEGETFDIIKNMSDYAKMLQDWSGRASLGKVAEAAPILGNIFYAPRFALGRLISPRHLFSSNQWVRKQAWRDATLFIGTIGSTVMLGAALGWWDVERDEHSADFMKIRIGNTHIDPWGGAQQFVVFTARVIALLSAPITGKPAMGKSSTTGMEYPLDINNLTENFLKSKQAPVVGLLREYLTGKTYSGEKVDIANLKQWLDRIAPMFIQDVIEAYQEQPDITAAAGLLSFTGFGVQTYSEDFDKNAQKLGLPKYSDNVQYGITEPVYDIKDWVADTKSRIKGVDPTTLTTQKGFAPKVKALAEAEAIQKELNALPNVKLTSLNRDPDKGLTFWQYYEQWKKREELVKAADKAEFKRNELQPDGTYKEIIYKGEDALKIFDSDERTRNAQLGNFSQRQLVLLNELYALPKDQQKAFIEKHEGEIDINPYHEWLKSHPKENGHLAALGQEDVYTKAAYDLALKNIKTWDIPDNAVDEYLPPKEIVDNYFKYQDTKAENEKWQNSSKSWESDLILAKDKKLREWLNFKPGDTPVASLELKVANHALIDEYESYSKSDDPKIWKDNTLKDENGKTARDRAQEALKLKKVGNETFGDIQERIEVLDKGANKFIADKIIELKAIKDKFGNASPQAHQWWLKNSIVHDWWVNNMDTRESKVWQSSGATEEKIINLDVQWHKEKKYYEDGILESQYVKDGVPQKISIGQIKDKTERSSALEKAHKDYLARNDPYWTAFLTRDALKKGIPENKIPAIVAFHKLPLKGHKRDHARLDDPELNAILMDKKYMGVDEEGRSKGLQALDPTKIPSKSFDILMDKWGAQYEDYYKNIPDKYRLVTNEDRRKELIKADRDEIDRLNPTFKKDRLRIQAYDLLIPESFVEDYVAYYSLPEKGYDQEWFLQENPKFYALIKKTKDWKKEVNFVKLPTREIAKLEEQYDALPKSGTARDSFRRQHKDFDYWGVLTGKFSKLVEPAKGGSEAIEQMYIEYMQMRKAGATKAALDQFLFENPALKRWLTSEAEGKKVEQEATRALSKETIKKNLERLGVK